LINIVLSVNSGEGIGFMPLSLKHSNNFSISKSPGYSKTLSSVDLIDSLVSPSFVLGSISIITFEFSESPAHEIKKINKI